MRHLLSVNRALLLSLFLGLLPLAGQAQPNAWINEFHYDDTGGGDDYVEIVVENAGSVDLSELDVELYRDDGTRYGNIGDVDTDFNQESTSGSYTIYTWTTTLQNGSDDGLALCFNDTPLQVLSYEGTFMGAEDCANGENSIDIGVSEDGSNLNTTSLQLEGSGGSYSDFTWTGPVANTKGSVNTGQTLTGNVTITVDDDGPADHSSIQDAIDAASSGQTVDVAAGTYPEQLDVTIDNLTIMGASESGVQIVPPSTNRGIEISADGVTFENATLDASNVADYGIKAQGENPALDASEDRADGLTLRSLTVGGAGVTEVDLNGVDNAVLEDLTLNGKNTAGTALAVTDGNNITMNNISSDGKNLWGGIALYAGGGDFTQGVNNVTITGNPPSEGIYKQVKSGFDVTNLDLPSAFQHTLRNSTFRGTPSSPADSDQFTFYVTDQATAVAAALGLDNPDDSYVQSLSRDGDDHVSRANNFVVGTAGGDVMSIQTAIDEADPGAAVNVLDGTYAENVVIDKQGLIVQDASTPTLDGSFEISANDVEVEGFKILGGVTTANPSATIGIYVHANTSGHALSNNTITGPGDRGILLGTGGVIQSTIGGNDISDWTSGIYLNTGASDLTITGNTFKNNTAGIGSDGISDLSITENLFTENDEGFGASSVGTGVTASNNCITDNGVGVKNYGGETITASDNYWGAPDGPSGDFQGSGDAAIGNITVDFSTEKVGACPSGEPSPDCVATTLEESVSNPPDGPGVVTSTFSNSDGILEIAFEDPSGNPELNNFDVTNSPSGFSTSDGGITWTADNQSNPPTTATFELTQATQGEESSYFAKASSVCPEPDPLVVDFDPIHGFDAGDPSTLTFSGNYPNPFRAETTVEFALPEQTDVRLSVYNLMGQKVATLVNGPERAGPHEVTWQGQADGGQQLASGVYLMRLEAGDRSVTRRVTIVR